MADRYSIELFFECLIVPSRGEIIFANAVSNINWSKRTDFRKDNISTLHSETIMPNILRIPKLIKWTMEIWNLFQVNSEFEVENNIGTGPSAWA